jgi:site-specific DNA recombinase
MDEAEEMLAAAMPAALYLRVSTGRQAEHDLSIPDQRRQASAYCESKGWAVAAEFLEPGSTATDDRRPGFQSMIDAAGLRPPPFKVIVVHSFSRFFRDQFQFEFYVRRLAKNGVRLVSITQDLGDDPMSVMMRQIMTLFDEYQSKENAKHTLRAMQENARQGYWNGGARPPFGYQVVTAEMRGARAKRKLAIDPTQAEVVRLMFQLAAFGDGESAPMGLRLVAQYLNSRGIRTGTGGRWGLGAVHQILTRTTYVGRHQFNVYSWRKKEAKPDNEVVEMTSPAILDEALFETVQAVLRSRSPAMIAPRFVNGPTLLGGICFCADCGGAMTLRTSGKGESYRYYTCCTAARQGKTGCKGRTVPMDRLDGLVVQHLEKRLLDPERLSELLAGLIDRRQVQAARSDARLAELRKVAAEADAKLTRLYAAIESGVADPTDPNLKGRLTELKRVRDSARADVERAEARDAGAESTVTPDILRRFATEARKRLRDREGGFRRHYVQALVQRVEVASEEIRICGSPGRLLQSLAPPIVGSATADVRSFEPGWLPEQTSNLRLIGSHTASGTLISQRNIVIRVSTCLSVHPTSS